MASPSVFNKNKLSGSTNGRGIKVTATTAGTAITIHTAVSGTSTNTYDEIWIWAVNSQAAPEWLQICWGGTADPNIFYYQLAGESGLFLAVPGLVLQNGMVVKAFADSANVIMVHGYVNEVRP
jgi:hypothetical protein